MNSVITLISDYGAGSPYTASLLGSAMNLMPEARVIEISHHISSYDILQAAFHLRLVYKNFPPGTLHLICIDTSIALHKQYLLVEVDGHYFIGADNGIFSLIFDQKPSKVYKILDSDYPKSDLFPEKNLFLPLVAGFLKKGDLKGLAEPGEILNVKQGIEPVPIENGIRGTVMMVDGYGNAITNIHRRHFDREGKGRAFKLFYWNKQYINKISSQFHAGSAGDDILLFNESGYLMVAVFKGKGAQLLGLKPLSKVVLEFE